METNLDQNQPLLSQLCQVLNHPDLPALLQCLTDPEFSLETKESAQETLDHLTLLQKMEDSPSSKILRNQLSPSEMAKSRKRL